MPTRSAARAASVARSIPAGVASRAELRALGVSSDEVATQVDAGRWRTIGLAVVLHNGPVSAWQRRRVCLFNSGPHAVLTSFTAAQEWGLRRWERDEVHVAVPLGAELTKVQHPLLSGLIRHQIRRWDQMQVSRARRLHALAPALVLAASSFTSPRPGCGLLAASVQQRLLKPDELRRALRLAIRARHRRSLLLAVGDIEQGAHALSEIDFRRLCRRYGLPAPTHQAVRYQRDGRRRYLDAQWQLPDGRVLGVEVDGAYHQDVGQWTADQLRQNEVLLGGVAILRYPAVVVREMPELVAAQLAQALGAKRKGLAGA